MLWFVCGLLAGALAGLLAGPAFGRWLAEGRKKCECGSQKVREALPGLDKDIERRRMELDNFMRYNGDEMPRPEDTAG